MTERRAIEVRVARRDDVPEIIELIRGLADFEKLRGPDAEAAKRFDEDFAEPKRPFEVLVAASKGELVGYALYFFIYSTFSAQPKLYIEDLFVRSEHRSHGVGRSLFAACAAAARRSGCRRMEWAVLDWNVRAQSFYRTLGAEAHPEWQPHGLEGAALAALAAEDVRRG